MLTIIPGDVCYLALCAALTVGMQLTFFAVAYCAQFDTVTDFAGSTNFILIALLTLCASGEYTARQVTLTTLVLISRTELAAFLLYRVLRRGKDERFDAVRGNFFAFLFFWVFQMIWAFGVSLPVMFVNGVPTSVADPPFGAPADVAGVVMFGVGFVLQVAADLQKDAFRAAPANRGRTCSVGVWAYSRHPNFFSEILMWWGIFVLASPVFAPAAASPAAAQFGWGYATIISPLLTFVIIMFLSGMPTAEGKNLQRYMRTRRQRDEFLAYRLRTSPLIPMPQCLYAALPGWLQAVALFEWPMYATDWDYLGSDDEDAAKGKDAAAGAAAATATAGSYQEPPPPPYTDEPPQAQMQSVPS